MILLFLSLIIEKLSKLTKLIYLNFSSQNYMNIKQE